MIRTSIVTAGLVVTATVLAGCGPEPAQADSRTPSRTQTGTGPLGTPSPSASGTVTPTKATTSAASAVDPALASALDTLAARSRAMKSDAAMAQVRTSVSEGLAASRNSLQATREAAYRNGTRDCSQVGAHTRATQAGAARVTSAAAALTAAAGGRQRQLDALNASIAEVRRLAAQRKAAVPSAADIAAAVAAASAQSSAEATALADTRAATADGAARARSMSATAAEIYAKTC